MTPMTKQELVARIAEAWKVERQAPNKERAALRMQGGSWPAMIRGEKMSVEEYLERRENWGEVTRDAAPATAAIDRAVEMYCWMSVYLRSYPTGRQILWATYGAGDSLEKARRRLGRKIAKATVYRYRKAALEALLHGINDERVRKEERAPKKVA